MGEEWLGGDVANGPGGAHKINLLKRSLNEFKDRSDLLILFTDAYDVVITGTQNEILNRYNQMNNERDHKLKGISLYFTATCYENIDIFFYDLMAYSG